MKKFKFSGTCNAADSETLLDLLNDGGIEDIVIDGEGEDLPDEDDHEDDDDEVV